MSNENEQVLLAIAAFLSGALLMLGVAFVFVWHTTRSPKKEGE